MHSDQLRGVHEYLGTAEARQLYVAGDAAHDFDHVWRVTQLARQLAEVEGADAVVVRLAALLHDVPVTASPAAAATENGRRAHHLAAAAFAR
ncbi:MAG: HD domain-containing protein, partial [Caldilineaceae bacterium]|nr:HD domain-containing protein [Caldilineaceae bacterium]